ncbi:hypothetical protein [Bacillus atrophaeus]
MLGISGVSLNNKIKHNIDINRGNLYNHRGY